MTSPHTAAELAQEHERHARRIGEIERELGRARALLEYLDEIGGTSGRTTATASAERPPSAGAPVRRRRRGASGLTIQSGLDQLLAGGARLKLREIAAGLAALGVSFKSASLHTAMSKLKSRGLVLAYPAEGRGDMYGLP